MTGPEWDFDVWRDGDHIHARGLLDTTVTTVMTRELAHRVGLDLADSTQPADRELANRILAACQDGAA